RVGGVDRYATSVAVAEEFVAARRGAGAVVVSVVVASGESLVDALAAVTLASALDAPVVLTRSGSLPASVAGFVSAGGFSSVVVVGGVSAVSPAVVSALAAALGAGGAVERVGGSDRYATAVAIARRAGAAGVWCDGRRAAVVVGGEAFADAVVVSPLAFALGLPLLLTGVGGVPAVTERYLAESGIERVVVVGGTAVVPSEALLPALRRAGVADVTRLSGADRFATSVEVAEAAGGCASVVRDPDSVALVNGTAVADGVVAGPLLGAGVGGNGVTPMLLVFSDVLPPVVARFLAAAWPAGSVGAPERAVVAVGGRSVVSEGVVDAALAVADEAPTAARTARSPSLPPLPPNQKPAVAGDAAPSVDENIVAGAAAARAVGVYTAEDDYT
ncbi:MAG TPA: hypothetical protein DEP69_03830, partial [Acidimicrobiaceae bacterium]|nr:hypothetical protein [Acidimicrobiaceae bacterium]